MQLLSPLGIIRNLGLLESQWVQFHLSPDSVVAHFLGLHDRIEGKCKIALSLGLIIFDENACDSS